MSAKKCIATGLELPVKDGVPHGFPIFQAYDGGGFFGWSRKKYCISANSAAKYSLHLAESHLRKEIANGLQERYPNVQIPELTFQEFCKAHPGVQPQLLMGKYLEGHTMDGAIPVADIPEKEASLLRKHRVMYPAPDGAASEATLDAPGLIHQFDLVPGVVYSARFEPSVRQKLDKDTKKVLKEEQSYNIVIRHPESNEVIFALTL